MLRSVRYSVGVDEVGRGCLAGPVTVAAVAIPARMRFFKLKDSKRLTAKQREEWFGRARKHPMIFFSRANVYPKTIDRINVSNAANLAATRALKKIAQQLKCPPEKLKVFLDGGLYLNFEAPLAKTVIKGDERYNSIKLASIVAKVNRDRIISRNHRDYPAYGLAEHKGYGTKRHIRAIKKYGPAEIHRLTFIKNFYKI